MVRLQSHTGKTGNNKLAREVSALIWPFIIHSISSQRVWFSKHLKVAQTPPLGEQMQCANAKLYFKFLKIYNVVMLFKVNSKQNIHTEQRSTFFVDTENGYVQLAVNT